MLHAGVFRTKYCQNMIFVSQQNLRNRPFFTKAYVGSKHGCMYDVRANPIKWLKTMI
jgi:hypothetical protein